MYRYFEVLQKYSYSQEAFEIVLRHSLEVLAKSIEIINKKELYERVDFDLIISGAILHDIGALGFIGGGDKKDYITHGIIGAGILEEEGLVMEALIAKRHTGSGLSREDIIANKWPLPKEDFLPVSLEEKIICYADKFSSKTPGKKDTLESIEEEFRNYGEGSLRRFLELKEMLE